MAITSCRSSRFLPVTRTSSPWMAAWTLILESLISLTSFLATSLSIPCLNLTFRWKRLPECTESPTSMELVSILRLSRALRSISTICLSWKSASASSFTSSLFNSKLASTPRKSKRVASSRLALSTAFNTSFILTSETISNDGITGLLMLYFRLCWQGGKSTRKRANLLILMGPLC